MGVPVTSELVGVKEGEEGGSRQRNPPVVGTSWSHPVIMATFVSGYRISSLIAIKAIEGAKRADTM